MYPKVLPGNPRIDQFQNIPRLPFSLYCENGFQKVKEFLGISEAIEHVKENRVLQKAALGHLKMDVSKGHK